MFSKSFINTYISTHFHVSIAVAAMCGTVSYLLKVALSLTDIFGVGISSWLGYYYITQLSQRKFSVTHFLIPSVLSVFCFWYWLQLNGLGRIFYICSSVLVLFYPKIEGINFHGLRQKPGWKILIVALAWSFFCVGIPYSKIHSTVCWQLSLGVLLFSLTYVTAAMIPFEIRDETTDSPQLQTIVNRYGIVKSKAIGYGLTVIAGVCLVFPPISLGVKIWILVSLGLLALGIYKSPSQQKYFCEFWIEGIPIAMFLGVYLLGF